MNATAWSNPDQGSYHVEMERMFPAAPVLARPIAPRDGFVAAPDVPGTGIDWDEDAVRRYAA